MAQKDKTKEELVEEITLLQKRIAELGIADTERKRAEQAAKDTAYQLQTVVESVGEGITFSDSSGKFSVYNFKMQELTGYTVDEANNSGDFTKLLYPQPLKRQKALQRLQEIVEHKVALPLEVETIIQAKDGTKKVFWVSTVEIRFKGREMFLSIYRDITKRKRAEEALREEKERFRLVSSTTSDIVYSCKTNEDGRFAIDWIAGASEGIIGYSIDEIKAQSCWGFLVIEEDLALFKKNVTDLSRGSRGLCELRFRHKNGAIVWVVSYAECIQEPGHPEHLMLYGGLANITERKRAEEVLKKSKELLLGMTTQVPGVVYQFYARPNGEMGFYYVSDRSKGILGLKPDLEGYLERLIALIIPEHREGFIKSIEKSVKELSEWKYEGMLQKPSGEKIWFSGNSIPLRRENEIVFNGIAQDITERKREIERYETIVKSSLDGFWLVDMLGNIKDVNDSYCAMIGYRYQELLGMKVSDLEVNENPEDIRTHLQKVKELGRDHFESRHKCKDGSIIDLEINLTYPKNLNQVFMFAHNITERKKTEEKERKHLQELEVFYKASIRREERIIELKKEVKMLKKELGK